MNTNTKIGIGVGAGLTIAGIASCSIMDRVIDVTSHAHNTSAYRNAGLPTRILAITAAGLGVAGLLAMANHNTKKASGPLLAAAAGAGAAFGVTLGVRLGWGLLVAPAQASWKPGMVAEPGWRIGDMAANSIDRYHMMGREMNPVGNKFFDVVSRVQGHGPLAERTFVPLLHDEVPNAAKAVADAVS